MELKKIREIIAGLTLEEKASMLSGKSFWETRDIPHAGIPSAFLADGPHGIRKQAVSADHLGLNESLKATCFPTSATVANSWDAALGEQMGAALGQEARAQKVNVLLGPGVNIKRNPLCGRNFEYFSEDPYLAGKMGAAYIRGIQSNGVSACVKHFAANNQEERRMVIDTLIDERTMREIYLTAFEIAVKEGKVKSIMSAYNRLNGEYANESMQLLRDILRREWDFEGVIVTDWGGCNDRVEGLKAGNELEMPTTGGETNRDVIAAVKTGKIPEALIDEALERLLTLIFDTEEAFKGEREKIDADAHHAVALQAAESSIVLLKNENKVLPLKSGTRVAIVGDFANKPRYQGAGSSLVNPFRTDSALALAGKCDFRFVGYEAGFKRFGKKNNGLVKKACALAVKADVVLLYLGLDEGSEMEGLDRSGMKLPKNQLNLLLALKKTSRKIVVVLSCGAAVEMNWADEADAVLHAYLGGQAGAEAVLNIVTGKANPSGKLAESYPIHYEDCPSAANFPGKQKTVEYREGPFIGYRYYDTAAVRVKYPFGFGLSYTTFAYNNLQISEKGVTFDLTNTGMQAGAEVVQLYIGMAKSQIFRPKKELKGFKKIALQPGEKANVEILFDAYSFRYYDVKLNSWAEEKGAYQIYVGASSEDLRLKGELLREGIEKPCPYVAAEIPSYYSGKADNVSREEFQKLYGKVLPNPNYDFYKKKRMKVNYNTTISELRYAPGWVGRFFAWGVQAGYKLMKALGKTKTASMLMMGIFHQPVRGLSRMTGGAISWGQLDGFILMFNGHFFKGLGKFWKEGRMKKRRWKAEKKALKEQAKAEERA